MTLRLFVLAIRKWNKSMITDFDVVFQVFDDSSKRDHDVMEEHSCL